MKHATWLLIVVLAGVFAFAPAASPSPQDKDKSAQPTAQDQVRALAREKLALIEKVEARMEELNAAGMSDGRMPAVWVQRRLDTELQLATTKAERIAVWERHLKLVEADFARMKQWIETGHASTQDLLDLQYQLFETKMKIAELKADDTQ